MNTSRGLDWWAWQGLNLRPLRCQRSPVSRKWRFSAGFACFNTGTRVEHRGVPLRFYRAVTAHETAPASPASENRGLTTDERLRFNMADYGYSGTGEVLNGREIKNVPGASNTWNLPKDENYVGPLADKQPEEVAYILTEALDYLGIGWARTPPMPIDYGHGNVSLKEDENACDAYLCVVHMLRDIAQGKPRAARAAWTELAGMFREVAREAVNRYRIAEAERSVIRHNMKKTFVYFIGGEGGDIKIGFSNNPKSRLSQLQTSSPVRLSILATVRGKIEAEGAYHQRFAAHRKNGEWFDPHPEILAEIARLNQQVRG